MGAGKTTIGREAAKRLGRPFHDVDDEIERGDGPIRELFAAKGEAAFREIEARFFAEACGRREPSVIAVGGGAVERRGLLADRDVLTVLIDVDVETAWERVQGSRRPLAQDEAEFRRRYDLRAPLYADVAQARARDVDGVVLAAGGVHVERGALARLGELVPGDGATALVSDATVAAIHGPGAARALDTRLTASHTLPPGEDAKTFRSAELLWRELRLGRDGTLVALGGGCATDAAGFVAATYLRGIDWVAVPTTLVGQVDAAIGGKTALNLPEGKNLVGAFHWPTATVVDPQLLATLPAEERREGLAEVVKTGLLVGEPLWELPEPEGVVRCAAYKTAICLRDPRDQGPREVLNLGHTFAHALETASDHGVSHGSAVALGLLAALRLSGLPTEDVERVLAPRPVRADRDRAWGALQRDKKRRDDRTRLVLLEAPGRPKIEERPADEVRAALDALIAR